MKDIVLNNDDVSVLSGDFAIGESYTQEVASILKLNQGDLKSDPLLGPNLVRLINSNISQEELQTVIKVNLSRDGKDYADVKDLMELKRNTNE
ncbi:MAG: hypothetical protein IE931_03315 [Sphingobacteriales bacterium]|nr:hypothetical protein [Sphingobacteriales bacterium]